MFLEIHEGSNSQYGKAGEMRGAKTRKLVLLKSRWRSQVTVDNNKDFNSG